MAREEECVGGAARNMRSILICILTVGLRCVATVMPTQPPSLPPCEVLQLSAVVLAASLRTGNATCSNTLPSITTPLDSTG